MPRFSAHLRSPRHPIPVVTGPIPQTAPGDASHNYSFFSSNHDLAGHGYVEEEFFIQGTANRYTTPNQTNPDATSTGTIISSGNPYKTRIVVRRPVDPEQVQRSRSGRVVQRHQQLRRGERLVLRLGEHHALRLRLGRRFRAAGRGECAESMELSLQHAGRDARQHGERRFALLRYLLPGGTRRSTRR